MRIRTSVWLLIAALFLIGGLFLEWSTISYEKGVISEKYNVPVDKLELCFFDHRLGKYKHSRTYEYDGKYYTIDWFNISVE